MPGLLITFFPLLAMLAMAAVVDHRSRRIPNALTLFVAVSGMLHSLIWAQGGVTIWHSVGGFALGVVLNLPLFILAVRGGGDLKLFAGVGAWIGPVAVFQVFVFSTVIAMFVAIAQAAATGRLRALFSNSSRIAVGLAHDRQATVEQMYDSQGNVRSVDRTLPYAIPILAATLLLLAMP